MKFTTTGRGFAITKFQDRNDIGCSLQKSSIATEDCIWLGVDDAQPVIMARDAIRLGLKPVEGGEKDNGWVPFPVPQEVLMHTRMHLTRQQAKELAEALTYFADNGELPE